MFCCIVGCVASLPSRLRLDEVLLSMTAVTHMQRSIKLGMRVSASQHIVLQNGVAASNHACKARAVELLGLLLSGAQRSESLAGCSSVLSRHVAFVLFCGLLGHNNL